MLAEPRPVPLRDAPWARGQLQCPWDVVRAAAGLASARVPAHVQSNIEQWPLPTDERKRLRKIARLAVLAGGAVALALGRFQSLRGDALLPMLRTAYPQWAGYLDEVERRYIQPSADATAELRPFHERTVAWMGWCAAEIERMCERSRRSGPEDAGDDAGAGKP